jgi:hypothetical protein
LLQEDVSETNFLMCELLQDCFDCFGTQDGGESPHWDKRHFCEPVYHAMNEEMFQSFMGYLPQGHAKIGKDKLLKGYCKDASDVYPTKEKGDDRD